METTQGTITTEQQIKICPKCGNFMPIGRKAYYCFDCKRAINKKYYNKNKEHINKQVAAYRQTGKGKEVVRQSKIRYNESKKGRVAQRKHNAKESTKLAKKHWAKSECGMAIAREKSREYRATEKGNYRCKVQCKTWRILRSMDLSEQRCEICDAPYQNFHHTIYDINNPLIGFFVCIKCHKAIHMEEGRE